ncbi:MAG: gliding motility-associated C-terminal domain-containing protein, partial [Flavobacteriales bacterium]|nr:gliding motility-associated C-terminal domain-containing protein [Flavobacteriales bacterium]
FSSADVTCSGLTDGTATVVASGGTTPYTYLWNTSPAQTDSAATNLGAGNYNCIITDLATCSVIVAVTISEPPPVTVTVSPDLVVCPGEVVTISASATGGTLPYFFTWDNGLGNDSVHTITVTQDTVFTVIVLDANLCPGGSAQSIAISVGTPVSVIAGGAAVICIGDSTLVTAAGFDGTIPYTYDWTPGVDSGAAVWVKPVNTTTYTVTISDSCGATATATVLITITPDLVLTPPAASICPGESVTLTASGGLFYFWWEDQISADTLSWDPTITVAPSSSTNYIILASDGTCEKIDTAVVTVNNSLMAAFIAEPEIAIIVDPTIQFTDLTQGNPISWNWNFGDSNTDTIQHPTHTYADTGKYIVMLAVEDINGCRDTVYFTVEVKETYTLFAPNTFTPDGDGINDYFFPKALGIKAESFEFYIFNRWGDLIFESDGVFGNYKTAADRIGWDGKANHGDQIAQQDVYIWMIKTEDPDRARHQYVGHVTLLR